MNEPSSGLESMKGFLSSFLKNYTGDKKPDISLHHDPNLIPPISSEALPNEAELHPDEIFIDYDDWEGSGLKTSDTTTASAPKKNAVGTTTDELDASFQDEFFEERVISNQQVNVNLDEPEAGFTPERIAAPLAVSACVKCGASFKDFSACVNLLFCPFCGAEQCNESVDAGGDLQPTTFIKTNDFQTLQDREDREAPDTLNIGKAPNARENDRVSDKPLEFIEHPDTFEEEESHNESDFGSLESDAPTSAKSKNGSSSNDEDQKPESFEDNLIEEAFLEDEIDVASPQESTINHNVSDDADVGGSDETFIDDAVNGDLANHQPPHQGQNSYTEWDIDPTSELLADAPPALEDWEIFLDENLEAKSQSFDEFHEDEDPLETGKIVEYASRLTSQIFHHQTKDRKKAYVSFVNFLGDFPYYQSYAAIGRLLSKELQIEDIKDVHSVKFLWLSNPNIWSERRWNRMESMWVISRNSRLRNSMSWQLAADLVRNYPVSELENLILVDWYNEWINLRLSGENSKSGVDPCYGKYPTYLNEKRKTLP